MKSHLSVAIFVIAMLFVGITARAATTALSLADHTPPDAVAYVGWAGTDALAPAYRQSPLLTLVEGSNLSEVTADVLPKLRDRLTADVQDKSIADTFRAILPIYLSHPAAVYVTDAKPGSDANLVFYFGLLCDAGNDAGALLAELNKIEEANPDMQLEVDRAGSVVRITNGAVETTGSLARTAGFLTAMKPMQSSPALAIFVDGHAILHQADELVAKNQAAHDIWQKVREALGITGIKTFAMTAGFDGGKWVTASALIAPGPRTGILAAFEPRPIDPALLARIPGSAESVAVYNFDAAKLFDTLAAAAAVTPDGDTMFHRGAGAATMVLGRNLRRAILGPLGPQWIIYTDSHSHNTAMLNHPTDADTASDSMVSAAFGIINTANAQVPGVAITAVQQKIDGIDLTSAKSTAIERFVGTPTFAVQDGIFYFAGSPEAVIAAAKLAPVPEAGDFLHETNFAATLYRLRVPNPGSIDYCDLTRTAPLAVERLKSEQLALAAFAKMAGFELPAVTLPSVDKLGPQLSPAMSVSWADADGVYTKSISPFPGSSALLGDPQESLMSVGTSATVAAILLPAIAHSREQATQAANMKNERDILLAMITWSMQHQGSLPPDLGTLVGTPPVDDPRVFLRHGSGTRVPAEIENGTPAEQAAWVNEHAEFTYLNAGKKFADLAAPATTPLLIEKHEGGQRSAVGFADGHAEIWDAKQVKKYQDSVAQ